MQDMRSLQEENAALRRLLAERDAQLAELTAIESQLKAARLEIEQMRLQLATWRRQRFGHSSEKLDQDIVQLELRLEDLEENIGQQIAAKAKIGGGEPKPLRKSAERKPLPAHLPREVVVHEPEILHLRRLQSGPPG